MRKYLLQSYFLIDEFQKHNDLKGLLLDAISKAEEASLNDAKEDTFINKLDWVNNQDFEREWVKILYKDLYSQVNSMAQAIGFKSVKINELWFQQYIENNKHNWHGHGSNFTCVYYLEMADDSPCTELVEPFSMDNKFTPDIKEGSILIFPSYVIHRAPKVKGTKRKTIISFNVDFEGVTEDAVTLFDSL